MSIEVNVVGMRCGAKNGGLDCAWCYETPLGRANEPIPVLKMDAVRGALDAIEKIQGCKESFSLFGGEPMLAPLETLEELWAEGLKRHGKNGVQTSGRPIREEHFPLFHKYKVSVSFSIEGPEELNDSRWAGSTEETRKATAHSIAMMKRCSDEEIPIGLITTLYRKNSSAERLPRLLDWFRELDTWRLYGVNLHVLEHDGRYRWLALSHEENIHALLALYQLQIRELKHIRFPLFTDLLALLRAKDAWKYSDGSPAGVGCTWTACDPMTTPAVQGIDADGRRSLCPRVYKDSKMWGAAERGPLVRQLVLRNTPQEEGGCQGCRHIITCKGQCPGTALDGDWRKRSRDCELWKGLLEHFEGVLLQAGEVPVTLRPDRDKIEERMVAAWEQGMSARLIDVVEGGQTSKGKSVDYGDHSDHQDHTDLSAVLLGVQGEKVNEKGEEK